MRRAIPIFLFVLVLAVPFALRQLLQSRLPPIVPVDADAATLVIVTPNNQDIRREFARAFDAWHREKYGQGVRLDFRTPGGTNDIKRLLETTYRGYRDLGVKPRADIDMVWGGGDFFHDVELKPLGLLRPMDIDPAILKAAFPEPTLAGVKLYDYAADKDGNPQSPTWVGVCLSSFGIVYNPDLYRALGLATPKQWRDLDAPALAGAVALADPTHSGSAAVAYMMVLQRAMADAEQQFFADYPDRAKLPVNQRQSDPLYREAIAAGWHRGMGQLLLMAANARYFTDSASQVSNDVSTGDAAVGVAIDFYARVTQESVGPDRVQFVLPAAATAITPDPIGILTGVEGHQLVLAQHFVEFLLSTEGQRLWALKKGEPGGPVDRALRRMPIRRDIYRDQTGWSDHNDPFTEAGGFNQRPQWMSLFAEARTAWAAAWLDSRDALKSAYRAVLSIDDPQARDGLIQKLADLPITLDDLASERDLRRQVQQRGEDVDEWQAARRIHWANIFRRHYRYILSVAHSLKGTSDDPR